MYNKNKWYSKKKKNQKMLNLKFTIISYVFKRKT